MPNTTSLQEIPKNKKDKGSWKKFIIPLAFLALSLLSLSLLFSIGLSPAFVPLLWEIMFSTPAGFGILFSLLSVLTIGLCGFILNLKDNDNALAWLPKNKYIRAILQGSLMFILGATPVLLFLFVFPPLSPIIWTMACLSSGLVMMASGISLYAQLSRSGEEAEHVAVESRNGVSFEGSNMIINLDEVRRSCLQQSPPHVSSNEPNSHLHIRVPMSSLSRLSAPSCSNQPLPSERSQFDRLSVDFIYPDVEPLLDSDSANFPTARTQTNGGVNRFTLDSSTDSASSTADSCCGTSPSLNH